MKPKVLITREIKAAKATAAAVEALGYEALVYPLIEIELVKYELPDFTPDYLIITSLNAAQNLNPSKVPCLVVGAKSAAYLSDKGFDVVGVYRDAGELISCNDERSYKFLYLSADHIATDIPKSLTAMGHEVRRVVVYKSKTINTLDPSILKDLDFATFYSPRTARAFHNLCQTQDLSHITALALSHNVAENLKGLGFKEIIVSGEPNEKSLLMGLPLFKML